MPIMLALLCLLYWHIMLNAFATDYAHNYAGIIGYSLVLLANCIKSCDGKIFIHRLSA